MPSKLAWQHSRLAEIKLGPSYYSVRDIHPLLAGGLAERDVGVSGISRYRPRPPVMGLDFEIDVRDIPTDHLF